MRTGFGRALLWACAVNLACGCAVPPADLDVQESDSSVTVGGEVIHTTNGRVSDTSVITVPGTSIRIATWNETPAGSHVASPYFAINLGAGWHEAKKTSYTVPLRSRGMDPSTEIQSKNLNDAGATLHIVQYVSQPLEAFWTAIAAAGAQVHQYLHGNAQVVRGDLAAMKRISQFSFVRAVTPMRASDRIDPSLTRRDRVVIPVNIVLVDAKVDRALVEDEIRALGGQVVVSDRDGILVEAKIEASKVEELAGSSRILWLEQAMPIEADYDIARQQGGANFLESLPDADPALPGYTGIGIRGHIMEGIDPAHPDFAATSFRNVPLGVDATESDYHGMQTFGIVFGSGAGNARARGLLPDGQGYYTNNSAVMSAPEGGRSTLVGKLIKDHKVMFQTASWGNGTSTTYTAKSAEMDALILKHDIPVTQSMSNTGTQSSRPQAWAKNIISVGALYHFGTVTPDDDSWDNGGSIGPAADGSIKPDLAFYYDRTITTTLDNGYSETFGGTSGATPTVAGHVGLTIELWTNGVFGNPIIPVASGEDIASFRFKNRPHFTTTKALLIHSAKQYAFAGEADDRTRTHQGWGVPDLEGMYKRRTSMLVVNETDVLRNLEKSGYSITVAAGAPDLRATLVYADKEAAVPTTIHRVNNLDLKVIAPDQTIYWGNNGLKASMTSVAGGVHDVVDTVENVFVQRPQPGIWKIEVIADEINVDAHLETPGADADYALVVSTGAN